MTSELITDLCEDLKIGPPDWVPDEYEEAINHYVEVFSGKNQIPVRDSSGKLLYPINKSFVKNRVINQLLCALINGEEIPETDRGVELLLTKNPQYPIMLNGLEERALCKAMQQSLKIENHIEMELSRDTITDIAITFLSPRIRYIYRRFEKAVGACGAYEDVVQEMVLAMLKLLEDFNFERTTAGITKDFMNARMFKAINYALASNRASSMAQETWNKVSRFVAHTEDHRLSREEVKKKYHCSSGLVEIMFTFVENGSLEVSMDYTPTDIHNSSENKNSFGDMLPAKDYGKEEFELDLTLQKILQPIQYKVVKMKIKGFSHQAIADILGFDSKRKSQYLFICARKVIQREFDIDVSQYSKGKTRHRRKADVEAGMLDFSNDDFDESELNESVSCS